MLNIGDYAILNGNTTRVIMVTDIDNLFYTYKYVYVHDEDEHLLGHSFVNTGNLIKISLTKLERIIYGVPDAVS